MSCSGAHFFSTAATAGVGSSIASASTQFLRSVAPASESSNTIPGQSKSFTCHKHTNTHTHHRQHRGENASYTDKKKKKYRSTRKKLGSAVYHFLQCCYNTSTRQTLTLTPQVLTRFMKQIQGTHMLYMTVPYHIKYQLNKAPNKLHAYVFQHNRSNPNSYNARQVLKNIERL